MKKALPRIYTDDGRAPRKYVCRKCGGHNFYSDPTSAYRHCIDCENLRRHRLAAKKKKWERAKRPYRDRREYHKDYRRRKKLAAESE